MRLNLVVIRVADIDRAAAFYRTLGLALVKERHGSGPEHYSADLEGTILELYPRLAGEESTCRVRLGFVVESLEPVLQKCLTAGGRIVSATAESPWGRRAVIEDVDGHRIELREAGQR